MSFNPFTVGNTVRPDRFIGRTFEIAGAFDQIGNRSHLALWGSPGIGKSSFLRLITDPVAWQMHGQDISRAVPVMLSCLDLVPFSAQGFWREILEQLADLSDDALQAEIQQLIASGETTKDGLRKVLRRLGKQEKFLVLLVDDYDAALRVQPGYDNQAMEAFVSDCRNLASHSPEGQHLSMVVTSLRRLNELGPRLQPGNSPWFNHYLFQPLKPFSEAEILTLLSGLPMTLGLRDGIREMTGGHPALLQNAGHLLYRELRAGHVPDPMAFAQDFRSATSHLFEATWNLASDIEQILMTLVALFNLKGRLQGKQYDLGDIEMVFSQKERELLDLVAQGILVQKARSGEVRSGEFRYAFASSMMEWWVVEALENSTEASLQVRQKVFLNLMNHRQAQIVTDAIRWLWDNKEELPSILEWLVKVTSAFPKGLIPG
jgi:AAA ATPase domain